jgi:DNA-binding transcriptional LysR family regulator
MRPFVELRELRVFLTVAEELNFARAADRLGMNPSRVSQVIAALEAKVGGRVFDRTSRRVRATPLGERLRHSIAPLYEQLDRAIQEAREDARGVTGTLRMGMYTPGSTGRHMVDIVRTYEARHPSIGVAFVNTGFQRNYLDALRAGEIDILAARLPLTEPDVAVGPVLSREERVLLISDRDPLAERQSISLEDFADRPVSDVPALPREMMNAFIPPVSPSGRRYRRIPTRDVDELLMRVALGEQVHPTVRLLLDYLTHPGVTHVPIADLPPSETALAWLSHNHSPKVQAFVHAAQDVLARTELAPHQPLRGASMALGDGHSSRGLVLG